MPRRLNLFSLGLFCLGLFAWVAFFVYRHAVDLFYYDQWDAYTGLFQGASEWKLFRWQQGPHRMGLGIFLTQAALNLSGWNERVEQLMLVGLLGIGLLVALDLRRRLDPRPLDLWDLLLPAKFLSLASWESLVGTAVPSIGMVPFLLILVVADLLALPPSPAILLGLGVLQWGLAFTGHAYVVCPFLALIFGVLALDRRYRPWAAGALALSAFPAAVFGLTQKTGQAGVACFGNPVTFHDYAGFTGAYAMSLLGLPFNGPGFPELGILVFFALVIGVGALLTRIYEEADHGRRAKLVLLGSSVLFAVLSSYARACLGERAGYTSRYYVFMLPGWLVLYLFARGLPRARWRHCLLGALAAGMLAQAAYLQLHQLPKVRHDLARRAEVADCLRRGEALAFCERDFDYPLHPDSRRTGIQAKLDWMRNRGLGLFRR